MHSYKVEITSARLDQHIHEEKNTKTTGKTMQKNPKIMLVNIRKPCLQYGFAAASWRAQGSLFVTCTLSELPLFLKR